MTVAVIGDTATEANETFAMTLSNPSGATLATASSVHMGFPLVVLLALVCYGLAALAIRPLTRAG